MPHIGKDLLCLRDDAGRKASAPRIEADLARQEDAIPSATTPGEYGPMAEGARDDATAFLSMAASLVIRRGAMTASQCWEEGGIRPTRWYLKRR